jgi:putative DNA primase/helicase
MTACFFCRYVATHIMDNSNPVLPAVLNYLQRGWFVVPVPFRSKQCLLKKWPQLRITAETAPKYFGKRRKNVGIIFGEPSGWLIDIDLDHQRAVELAPQYLPPTPAVYGRPGKPRSHWLYRVTGPIATKNYGSKSAGMIVQFKSTGQQSVSPPSIHESGEPITWETEGAEPAVVDPDILFEIVRKLAEQVLIELGEKAVNNRRKPRMARPARQSLDLPKVEFSADERQVRCLQALLRIGIKDHNDGSLRLFTAACRAVEHDLEDSQALAVLREYSQSKPFATDWTDEDILRRIRDAEKRCQRGAAFATEPDGSIRLGGRDPATGKFVLSARRTPPTAEAFVREFYDHPEGPTLVSYAGLLLHWNENRYIELEDEAVRRTLQVWLHDALRYVLNRQSNELELVPFESNPGTVKSALDTIRNYAHLPAITEHPSWLRKSAGDPPASDVLPCRSKLLHLPTQQVISPTPAFFSLSALDFDPVPDAPQPSAWFEFLHQLFDGDVESLDLLQEWFGYCLTGDTSQQKMLFIVGPKRSGKGTIARVLAQLVGSGNVCGPTTSSLASAFGLQPLIGKTLAIVSDARFSGENVATVIERLLCISGEDSLTVDRKFMSSVTMKLAARFMFLSNELPRLNDASGALARRFLILRLTESFYGREDTAQTEKLLAELPGILNWAIAGWRQLRARGRFQMPASGADAMLDLEELSSPVSAFVRSECDIGAGLRVHVDDLYEAWALWCSRQGRTVVSTKQTFGRDLVAAFSNVHCRRGSSRRFYEGIGLKGGVL